MHSLHKDAKKIRLFFACLGNTNFDYTILIRVEGVKVSFENFDASSHERVCFIHKPSI